MKRALRSMLGATVAASLGLGAAELPPWEEVMGVVRSNLVSASEAELNAAAVRGFLDRLGSRVILEGDPGLAGGPAELPPLLARTNRLESAFAALGVGRVGPGLAEAVAAAVGSLQATQELKGVVLDLRFAGGEDFAEAGRTAGLWAGREATLLDWGEGRIEASGETPALGVALAVLVNGETRGAAEALAATVQALRLGVVLGSTTAGQASVFKAFTLSTGQRLRVAVAPVKAGGDTPVPATGLVPDLTVAVSAEEERAYQEDPYRVGAGSGRSGSRGARLSEADLVRLHRESLDPAAGRLRRPTVPLPPQVTDPVLVRALDLLKGLALVGQREP